MRPAHWAQRRESRTIVREELQEHYQLELDEAHAYNALWWRIYRRAPRGSLGRDGRRLLRRQPSRSTELAFGEGWRI